MNIQEQSEIFIQRLETRKRSPIKPNTLRAYRSYIRTWIIPILGTIDLAQFENGAMRKFVSELSAARLGVATIVSIVNCLKGVVASAQDENGNEIYPRPWNNEFIDLPIVHQRDQKAPIVAVPALEWAVSRAEEPFRTLYALLAASGLRISEGLALRAGPYDGPESYWDRDRSMLVIKGQVQNGSFVAPKTAAGHRECDISGDMNRVLIGLNCSKGSLLFEDSTRHETRHLPLHKVSYAADRDGIPGLHSLRRFRVTRLRKVGTPGDLEKFWIGHSSKDITDLYSRLAQDVSFRKEWAEKAGMGFQITR